MKWQDIIEQIKNGEIDVNSDVVVYDQSTGDEFDCDLIQFDDNGEVCIVINYDSEEE
jgi:hypothetical protein